MAITAIDGISKVIDVDVATESIPALYSEFANQHRDNLAWEPAFSTIADLPTVPVYATLVNGWKIRHANTGLAYEKEYGQGFLLTSDGSSPFVTNSGVEPRVIFREPVVAIGYNSGSVSAITQQDKDDIVAQVFSRVMENGETYEQQFRIVRADAAGSIQAETDGTYVVKSADGQTDRISGTAAANGGRTVTNTDGS